MRLTVAALAIALAGTACAPSAAVRVRRALYDGTIPLGATSSEVEAIGKPFDRHYSRGPWGLREQWIYDQGQVNDIGPFQPSDFFGPPLYLYFEDGKLTSWDD